MSNYDYRYYEPQKDIVNEKGSYTMELELL